MGDFLSLGEIQPCARECFLYNIPRMFAALLLLSLAGIAIFAALSVLTNVLLRQWHESAVVREG